MNKQSTNFFTSSKKRKIGLIILFIFLSITVIGLIIGSLAFFKIGKYSQSKDFSDSISVDYALNLPTNVSNESDKLSYTKQQSDKIYQYIDWTQGEDFNLDYAIANLYTENPSIHPLLTYGNIGFSFGTNTNLFNFNPDQNIFVMYKNKNELTNEEKDIVNNFNWDTAVTQQLIPKTIFLENFNYRLIPGYTLSNNADSSFQNFTSNMYIASNQSQKVAFDDTNTYLNVPLPKSTSQEMVYDGQQYWNLKSFQNQFSKVFAKEIETADKDKVLFDHASIIDALSTEYDYESPRDMFLFFTNRSKLIYNLQLSIFATSLYKIFCDSGDGVTNINNEHHIAQSIIKTLSPIEKEFGYWAIKNYNTKEILTKLNDSLEYDVTNTLSDPTKDPLIQVLRDFYNSYNSDSPILATPNDKDIITPEEEKALRDELIKNYKIGEPYAFLYSWNLKSNTLIQGYINSIDYSNFYKYFANNTETIYNKENPNASDNLNEDELILDKNKFSKENYYSKQITLTSDQVGNADLFNKLDTIINDKYYIESNLFSETLYSLPSQITGKPEIDKKNLLQLGQKFVLSTRYIVNENYNSIIGLPNYFSTFLAIVVIILLIGILVSILYRIPGLIATILTLSTTIFSALIYIGLGTGFSYSSVLALLIFSTLIFIPITFYLDNLRTGIKNGLNIYNANRLATIKFIKNSISIGVTGLIIGLVFLFFGTTKLESVGCIFVIISLMTLLFHFVFYLSNMLLLYGCNKNYKIIFNKKYCDHIAKTSNFKLIGQKFVLTDYNDSSLIDKFSNKLVFSNKQCYKNPLLYIFGAIILIALIGIIIFGVVELKSSRDFISHPFIYILTPNDVLISTINNIFTNSGLDIFTINMNVTSNGKIFVLELNNSLTQANFDQIVDSINYIDLGYASKVELLNNISLLHNNPLPQTQISHALIKCLFILVAFLIIWSLFWLNPINMLFTFITMLTNILVLFGIMGIISLGYNIDALTTLVMSFCFNTIIIFYVIAEFKSNVKKDDIIDKQNIFNIIPNLTKKIFTKFTSIYLIFSLSNIILIPFIKIEYLYCLLFNFFVNIILYIVNYLLISNFFVLGLIIRRLFIKNNGELMIKKYIKSPDSSSTKKNDFDKVDEQLIPGLNKFKK